MAYVITQNCCNDATCVTACPVNCIHPTPDEPGYATAEMLYIDPATCIDCGGCVPACPVEAIVPDYDLTDDTRPYRDINAAYYNDPAHRDYSTTQKMPTKPKAEVSQPGPLRVAIVGSGPAGCYAAEELLARKDLEVEVHVFERLPTPWGLVRFGVAPDHQGTKAVTRTFTATVGRRGVHLHLNVEVGQHIGHDELLSHHHAVIYAVGASTGRRPGVPGEDLPGSHSAIDFVAWYNGHPDLADQSFDLSCSRAIVIGNGNVALDVARILARDVDQLARTDIADHALDALVTSKIDEVVVLGRRGPAQAAFTTPELLGLAQCTGFEVVIDPGGARIDDGISAVLGAGPHSMPGQKTTLLEKLAARPPAGVGRRVVLRFLASPVEVLGRDRVEGLRVVRNELGDSGSQRLEARATRETEDVDCGLVLWSIGSRGAPVPGLPFDAARGRLPNERGRVIDPVTEAPMTGVYTSGWIKRGPSGVIGTNKRCAADTVEALVDDFAAGRLDAPTETSDALRALIAARAPDALDRSAWNAIDRYEQNTAMEHGRPRIKVTSIPGLLRVARSAQGQVG